ncbi:MAG: hypothetical protein ACI4TX_02855 [Christensenellales bacterium]
MKMIKSNKDGEQSSLDCESINLIKIKENKSIHFLSKKEFADYINIQNELQSCINEKEKLILRSTIKSSEQLKNVIAFSSIYAGLACVLCLQSESLEIFTPLMILPALCLGVATSKVFEAFKNNYYEKKLIKCNEKVNDLRQKENLFYVSKQEDYISAFNKDTKEM